MALPIEDSEKRMHILVVDDEPDVCAAYKYQLKYTYGFENIVSYTDPREALRYLEQHADQVDVVLLDLKMPHMDGLDLLRRIKDLDEAIQVVVVSAFSHLDDVKELIRTFGAQSVDKDRKTDDEPAIVDKPVREFDQLVEKLQDAFRVRQQVQNAQTG